MIVYERISLKTPISEGGWHHISLWKRDVKMNCLLIFHIFRFLVLVFQEILGHLLAMLFQWFDATAYLPDGMRRISQLHESRLKSELNNSEGSSLVQCSAGSGCSTR